MPKAGPLRLRNPVVLAAGILGDSPENLRAAYDAGAGAVVTKSITMDPREGNTGVTFIREGEGWLNSVGLKNPGAKKFAELLGKPDYPVIVSLAGAFPAEFGKMAGMFEGVSAFELNMSCPNVAGHDMGQDPRMVTETMAEVRQHTTLPVFVKVGINMAGAVEAAVEAGADSITAINTIPAMKLDDGGRPVFDAGRCGLSGPPIRPVAVGEVYRITHTYDTPVMGCGGVSTVDDAQEFLRAGAWAVQVGSAAMDDYTMLGKISAQLERRSR